MDKKDEAQKPIRYEFKNFNKRHFFPKSDGPTYAANMISPYVRGIAYKAKQIIASNPKMVFRKKPRKHIFLAFNSRKMFFPDLQELASIVINQIAANRDGSTSSVALLSLLHHDNERAIKLHWKNQYHYTSTGYLVDVVDSYACLALFYVDEAISMQVTTREDSLHQSRLLDWAERAIATGLSLTELCSYEGYGGLAKELGAIRRGKLQTSHDEKRIRIAQKKFREEQAKLNAKKRNEPFVLAEKMAWNRFRELRKENPAISAAKAGKDLIDEIQEYMKNLPRSEDKKVAQLSKEGGANRLAIWIRARLKVERNHSQP